MNRQTSILVVDDDPFVLESVASLLEAADYSVIACRDAGDALEKFSADKVEVVLTDIVMPGSSGIELLVKLRDIDHELPVILMTAYADMDNVLSGMKHGAFDFIIKPFTPEYLLNAVQKAVTYKRLLRMEEEYKVTLENTVRERTSELADALTKVKNMSNEIIQRLIIASEYRDDDTGNHIKRISFYAKKISEAIGMSADFIETITFAAPMHDVGKIGIPDNVLLKPGRLTTEEFEIIKTHTYIGEKILADSSYPKIQMASSIALSHHECWNGSGYPNGLEGSDIPIESRIVMLCDRYDALRSQRPYKPPFDHRKAFDIIVKGDERTTPEQFDPEVLKAFVKSESAFEDIFSKLF